MPYEAKNFEHLIGLEGFSDQLLKNHFTLYQGYVVNVNKLATSEFAEAVRRFGWEFNGMRLHELYFGNLKKGGSTLDADSELAKKIMGDFGSFEDWEKEFKAVGMMRGIGWTVLYYDPIGRRLFNVWVNEHDSGHLATCRPILVMDVFEHAYLTDYGLKRADYLEAFFKVIDWEAVAERFSKNF